MNTACSKMNTTRALIQKYWSKNSLKPFGIIRKIHTESESCRSKWKTEHGERMSCKKISNPFTSQVRLQKHTGQCEKKKYGRKKGKKCKKAHEKHNDQNKNVIAHTCLWAYEEGNEEEEEDPNTKRKAKKVHLKNRAHKRTHSQ